MTNTTQTPKAILPLPKIDSSFEDMAIYARFMQHLRHVPNSRLDIKILSAIQFTADIGGCSDAHVAKTLVEMGLRVSRYALPAEFLKYTDQALMRTGWEVGGASPALADLKAWWDRNGEDKFAAFRGEYDLVEARVLA